MNRLKLQRLQHCLWPPSSPLSIMQSHDNVGPRQTTAMKNLSPPRLN